MSSHAAVATRVERDGAPGRGTRPSARVAAGGPRTGGALGGEPSVSLLPAEVNEFHRARSVRRRLVVGIVMTMILVAAGIGAAFTLSVSAQAQRDAARAASLDLITQEAQFAELKQAKSGIALVTAGQIVGASTEIAWMDYLRKLEDTLPAGVVINAVSLDSATPFADYAQSAVPLEGSRVATIDFTASSPTLPTIPDWLDGLATLPGFADAVPGSLVIQSDGSYLVNITMHINSDAFALRFAEEASK